MTRVDIWMPLYLGDYLAETQRLSTEQHGAYLLLLIDYWRNGPPPDDDDVLQIITHLNRSSWRKHKSALKSLFRIEDGKLCHAQLDMHKAEAIANKDSNVARASRAATARWSRRNAPTSDATSNAQSNAVSTGGAVPDNSPPSAPRSSPSTHPTRRDDPTSIGELASDILRSVASGGEPLG